MDLKDRTCLVTGANSGIGKRTSKRLAEEGAEVVMMCRNESKGRKARKEIIEASDNENIHLLICDLSLMSSVRKAVEEFEDRFEDLNVLINNAGIISNERDITEEGNEKTFATNYLGHFLLTYLLTKKEKDSLQKIINVTSGAHKTGSLDFDDLQMKRAKRFSGWKAYSNSKLAQVMFTYQLARKLYSEGITVNSYHPGAVGTKFGKKTFLIRIIYWLFSIFMRGPEKAADDILHILTTSELDDTTGEYFAKKKIKNSSAKSQKREKQRKLWKKSKEIVGL